MSRRYADEGVDGDADEVVVEEGEEVIEGEEDEVIDCPEELGNLGELCNEKIPTTIDELQTNVEKIEQIKDFCSKKYFSAAAEADGAPEKLSAAYEETKKYLSSKLNMTFKAYMTALAKPNNPKAFKSPHSSSFFARTFSSLMRK